MEYLKYKVASLPHVLLTGKVYVPERNCHFTRKAEDFILYFVTKGSMILVENQITYKLSKGDILILDPSHTHSGIPVQSEIEYNYIHFTCDNMTLLDTHKQNVNDYVLQNKLNQSAEDTIIIPKHIHLQQKQDHIQNLIDLLSTDFQCKNELYKTQTSIKLLEILTNISLGALETEDKKPGKKYLTIQVLNFLHENARRNISSTEIESKFNMNFDYLNRIFKENTGSTIFNYSTKYRISESKKLLKSGLYNVKQTAELMGFSNEFYFSRVYKKYEGTSPSQFV